MQSLTRCISCDHPSSTTKQVMHLEAILVVGQENLDAHEVQEHVPKVVDLVGQKERQDH